MGIVKRTIWIFACVGSFQLLGQNKGSILESDLKSQSGFEKLATLNELVVFYEAYDPKKARKYARQAYQLADNFSKSASDFSGSQALHVVKALNAYGVSQYNRENYLDSKGIFSESKKLASSWDFENEILLANTYLQKVDSLADNTFKENFFTKKLTEINVGHIINNSNTSLGVSVELKMARASENKGDTTKAIAHYTKAAALLKNKGDFEKAEEIQRKIDSYSKLRELNIQMNELATIDTFKVDKRVPVVTQHPDSSKQLELQASSFKDIARSFEEKKDYREALAYYKRYTVLQRKWEKDSLEQSSQRALVLVEMERLRQQNEIADLNIAAIQLEKEAEVRLKKGLYILLSSIAIGTFIVSLLYISKRKKHKQLSTAYKDLDETKEELQNAKHHISKLLEQQVSPEIASALIEDLPEREKKFVAIMFLDIRGFTPIAEKMEPKELIDYQNKVFGFMIEIIQKYHGNINQFMGDGFMATFGAPKSHGNDTRNAFLAGKEILAEMDKLNSLGIVPYTSVGIGIHAGEVVTGNVGTDTRKQFSVTGNTVILAARIEQLNKTYSSNLIISNTVNAHIENKDLDGLEHEVHETKVKGRTEPIKITVFGVSKATV